MTDTKARKLTVVRTSPDALRLCEGELVHIGVDVHKATYHVAVYSGSRGVLATWVQPARPELLSARLAPITGQIAGIVYEAGPTGFGLARRLNAAGLPAQVIATSKILAPVGPEAKCDRLDCRRLALLAAKGLLHPVRIPTEQEEADRQVLRLREQLVRKSRSIQQQVKAFLLQHAIAEPDGLAHWAGRAVEALRGLELLPELRFCLDVMLDELEHVGRQVKRVTSALEELSDAEPPPGGCRRDADGAGRGPHHCDELPSGAARAPAVRPRGPGGADGRAGPAGPPERGDPPRGRPAPVLEWPLADGPGGVGLEVGGPR